MNTLSSKVSLKRSFRYNARLLSFLFVLLFIQSCNKKEDAVSPTQKTYIGTQFLKSSELLQEYKANDLKFSFNASAHGFIKGDVKYYRITYTTKTETGNAVLASGALLIPSGQSNLPLCSYAHGTLFPSEEKDAPSYNTQYLENIVFLTMASNGFVVSIPDYVGYGESKNSPHPYSMYKTLTQQSLDFMRAAREFCKDNSVTLNGKVFNAGWSEGGGVSMNMARTIESSLTNEFNLIASAPYAGPYTVSDFAKLVLSTTDDLGELNTYAWIIQTYNRVYNINRLQNYYFNSNYGDLLLKDVNANIPLNSQKLFTKTFITGMLNGTDTAMLNAFKDNDTYNWKPTRKLTMYHGDADDYVPIFNAQTALAYMKAQGSTQVQLKTLPGKGHTTGVIDYLTGMLTEWQSLK
jgi:pimeloyl-ACP methyl ester carboxylesterase